MGLGKLARENNSPVFSASFKRTLDTFIDGNRGNYNDKLGKAKSFPQFIDGTKIDVCLLRFSFHFNTKVWVTRTTSSPTHCGYSLRQNQLVQNISFVFWNVVVKVFLYQLEIVNKETFIQSIIENGKIADDVVF